MIFIEYTTILRPVARAFVYVEGFGVYVALDFSVLSEMWYNSTNQFLGK
ncbi:hypothetical protein HMPREF1149_0808 [Streptococcus sp. BS35b]|nr:hypothetical protein HMPREF1149_0808 [Streptococcus sp. BS35b]